MKIVDFTLYQTSKFQIESNFNAYADDKINVALVINSLWSGKCILSNH